MRPELLRMSPARSSRTITNVYSEPPMSPQLDSRLLLPSLVQSSFDQRLEVRRGFRHDLVAPQASNEALEVFDNGQSLPALIHAQVSWWGQTARCRADCLASCMYSVSEGSRACLKAW